MFPSDISQLLKSGTDGRYSDMDNSMDLMHDCENNELMYSEFFDAINLVENGVNDDYLNSSDELNALSDTSSHIDGSISPSNEISESSSVFTDDSVSPLTTIDAIDESLFDFLQQPVNNNFELETTPPVVTTPPKTTRIIIQNPVTKKVVNKPIINTTQIKKIGKKQIVRLHPVTNSGKPVILPYTFKNVKILTASDLDKLQVTTLPANPVTKRKVETNNRARGDSRTNPSGETREAVKLTSEERRLLDKEGIQLPTYHPLTKMEDRELKRIRRKIRNKISAQDSRKRKKEYVDGLEERVRRGSEENRNLMQRVKELQKKNRTLMAHINKLQSLLFNSSGSKATPSTCLMIVMISALLVSLPNLRLPQQMNNELSTEQEQVTTSRSLLSTKKEDDSINMEEFFVFNKEDENENITENELFKTIEEMEGKYESLYFEKDNSDDNMFDAFLRHLKNLFNRSQAGNQIIADPGGFQNKRGFIEPEIDEFDSDIKSINLEPPAKKMKLIDSHYHQNDENFVPFSGNIISATVQSNTMAESKDK